MIGEWTARYAALIAEHAPHGMRPRDCTACSTSDRLRAYATDLRATAEAYAVAADAPGLRRDAARYLYAESDRLTRESGLWLDRADQIETTGLLA